MCDVSGYFSNFIYPRCNNSTDRKDFSTSLSSKLGFYVYKSHQTVNWLHVKLDSNANRPKTMHDEIANRAIDHIVTGIEDIIGKFLHLVQF